MAATEQSATIHKITRDFYRTTPAQQAKDRRDFVLKSRSEKMTKDLHIEVMAVLSNSGLSFDEIVDRGGPCQSTLYRWERGEVTQPRLSTIIAALAVCGKSLQIR